jgi:hypothetical protein
VGEVVPQIPQAVAVVEAHRVHQSQEEGEVVELMLLSDQVVVVGGVLLQVQQNLEPEGAEVVLKGRHDPVEAEEEELQVLRHLAEGEER